MSRGNFHEALDRIDLTYAEIVKIANEIVADYIEPVNAIVNRLKDVNDLSNEEIRELMIQLSVQSFYFGEIKEKSAMKAQCAEALRKETYAMKYNQAEGTAGVKDNTATIESSDEIVAETLYELVSDLLKTKLDSTHRLIDTLKSVLMSRMQEAKLTMNVID